ncbi:MAG: AAA family ATPase [Planctomycetaceae bacterium]|nr:AAA family ATPase [Planctomycetaceae bacterium]
MSSTLSNHAKETGNGAPRRTASRRGPPAKRQLVESLRSKPDELFHEAIKLADELAVQQSTLEEYQQRFDQLRSQLITLTEPPHLPAIVTRVSFDGEIVEVQFRGSGGRMRVSVHADVDRSKLVVGGRVLLNNHRNCILQIDDQLAEWRDIGSFERQIDSHTVLLKHQEQQVPATLSNALLGEVFLPGQLIGFDRELGIALARVPTSDEKRWFTEDLPNEDFASLAGLDGPVAIIKRTMAFQQQHRAVAARYQLPIGSRLLFVGPPGNGKTKLARCTASYLSKINPGKPCRFMSIKGGEDKSPWFGVSESNLRARFAALREAAKQGLTCVFIDEIDAIGKQRYGAPGAQLAGSHAGDSLMTTLLAEIDGLQSLDGVIVIGATNRVDILDPALTRPGRFDRIVTVPPPSRRTARAVLQIYLNNGRPLTNRVTAEQLIEPLLASLYSPNGNYSTVVQVRLSDSRRIDIPARSLLSGAMLESLCREAAESAAVREIDGGSPGIAFEDLELALEQQLRSVCSVLTPGNIKSYVSHLPQDGHPVAVEVSHPDLANSVV